MKLSKIALTSLLLCSSINIASAQNNTGAIEIQNNFILKQPNGEKTGATINFTLIKDGKTISATSLTSNPLNGLGSYVRWNNIPEGSYELHCETFRWGSVIKRIGIVKGNTYPFNISDMPGDGKETIQGGNPSLFDLEKQIKALTAQIEELKAQLAAVQKAK